MDFHSKKVLITGVNGFTGNYLRLRLEDDGYEVYGLSQNISKSERVYKSDLSNKEELTKIIQTIKPNYIIHLAAISFVAHENTSAFYKVNVIGTENLLDAVLSSQWIPEKILISSSANVYGNKGGKISEVVSAEPVNHYACSKFAMERISSNFFEYLPIVITRPFNYTGVGQADKFLVPKIVNHFRMNKSSIELGNINVERDFSTVDFIVDSYVHLIKSPFKSEIFNICSGKSISLLGIVKILQEISGYEIDINVNPLYVRKNEISKIVGDNKKLLTGFPNLKVPNFKCYLKEMLKG